MLFGIVGLAARPASKGRANAKRKNDEGRAGKAEEIERDGQDEDHIIETREKGQGDEESCLHQSAYGPNNLTT